MTETIRVAAVQLGAGIYVEENLANCLRLIDKAAKQKPQLMVLPDGQGRDTALQTYNAIADMVEAPDSYDEVSIGNWFQQTEAELQSYCVRMQQMRNVALTKETFSSLIATANRKGFHISKQGVVRDDRSLANAPELAFYVVGQQRGGAI